MGTGRIETDAARGRRYRAPPLPRARDHVPRFGLEACAGPTHAGKPAPRGGSRVSAQAPGVGSSSSDAQHLSVRLSVHAGGVRLSEWAKREGFHHQTAWKWFKQGPLPVPARQTATGTILVDERGRLRRAVSRSTRAFRLRSARGSGSSGGPARGMGDGPGRRRHRDGRRGPRPPMPLRRSGISSSKALASRRHRTAVTKQLGISDTEAEALAHLARSAGMLPGQLGEALGMTSGGGSPSPSDSSAGLVDWTGRSGGGHPFAIRLSQTRHLASGSGHIRGSQPPRSVSAPRRRAPELQWCRE